mgnify:CR=1 FL=1
MTAKEVVTVSAAIWLAIKLFKAKSPVRQESTGERNLEFSQWLREHGRPSKKGCLYEGTELGCFVVNDLDFILWDYSRRMLQLLEVKTNSGKLTFTQEQFFPILDRVIRAGSKPSGVTYLGFHVLTFSGTTPSNSTVIKWDDKPITKEQCWRQVNMIDDILAEPLPKAA